MYQVTHKNGERFSAAKAYLTPNLDRPNLTVMTGAHTTRILLEGTRAVGVEVRVGGESKRLDLHDHVDVVQVVDVPKMHDLFGLSFKGIRRTLQGIGEWRRARRGMLTTNFAEAGGFIKSDPSETLPDLQLHFVIGKLVDHGRKTVFGHGYSCHVCLLRPKSRGSVTLASADAMAPPLIDPNFLAERDDVDRLIRGFKIMRGILRQPALVGYGGQELPASRGAQTDSQIEAFVRSHADTIYHPVGTCRMGSGPMDVVDASLRVHGVDSLRVVDASIMPSIVGGNTNAPVIAIAEKAADLIRHA
jgi:choline dehydrogenase-like flavoprotein